MPYSLSRREKPNSDLKVIFLNLSSLYSGVWVTPRLSRKSENIVSPFFIT